MGGADQVDIRYGQAPLRVDAPHPQLSTAAFAPPQALQMSLW
jgi:hypothetical protein